MVALMVRVPMTHNQRNRGVGASTCVSNRVVTRRILLEEISLDVAAVSPRLCVVPSPPELSRAPQGLRLAKTQGSGASLPDVGNMVRL